MTRPVEVIIAVHDAFRADIAAIDRAAVGVARGEPGLESTLDRFWRMNEVLAWHAEGEEASIFPALEPVAPDVVPAYEMDHRGLDAAFDALRAAVSVRDALDTARATAAFKFHLDLHLAKEEKHLYVLFEERLSEPEQAKAVSGLVSSVPRERSDFIDWLFPLIGDVDRENVLNYWQSVMPPSVYARSLQLVERATGQQVGDPAVSVSDLPSE